MRTQKAMERLEAVAGGIVVDGIDEVVISGPVEVHEDGTCGKRRGILSWRQ